MIDTEGSVKNKEARRCSLAESLEVAVGAVASFFAADGGAGAAVAILRLGLGLLHSESDWFAQNNQTSNALPCLFGLNYDEGHKGRTS